MTDRHCTIGPSIFCFLLGAPLTVAAQSPSLTTEETTPLSLMAAPRIIMRSRS